MLEHRTSNPGVVSSTLTGGTRKNGDFQGDRYLLDLATDAIEVPETPRFGSMSGPREAFSQVAERVSKLLEIIEEFADHQSVRCGWPAGYGQWKDGDCACGLTRMLREAGLPVEWAGGPPQD